MTRRLDDPVRLAALERSGLLVKPPTERMRHLVYTAYTLLKCDAAQINILSDTVSHTSVEWPRSRMSPDLDVTDSGCKMTLELEGTLVIPDAAQHPIACLMPWVTEFRGYIGTMLCYDKQPIGALCALTVSPRAWTPTDKMTIEGLADLVALAVE